MSLRTRRPTLFLPIGFLAAVTLALGRASDARGTAQAPLEPRTVILVRHAEKGGAGGDPELSKEGTERAQELARVLARAGATRLVASEFKRTQATLAPLAAKLSLAVDVRPAKELDTLAGELVAADPGSVTVVAGHSNTIPALAALLGAPLSGVNQTPQGPTLDESEYERLFVLHLPPNGATVKPSVLELRYGK